ncbi:MAG: hypothetical protein L6Q38_12040 [Nitrospira sp.]|nr:hypothetical protein [Nitrospira sp.]
MLELTISIVALTLALLAVGISAVSWFFQREFSDSAKLHERISVTESDLTDLADKVHHWMRRDSVRRTRASQPEVIEPQLSGKPALFARARAVLGARMQGVKE